MIFKKGKIVITHAKQTIWRLLSGFHNWNIIFASATTSPEASQVGTVAEKNEEPEDQNDPWKKLKDFAG